MKKIIVTLLALICTFSLAGCGEKNPPAPVVDEFANHKQVISLVSNYEVSNAKGFDYSLEQRIDSTVVNAHTISILLDNSNGTIGSRVEYKKDLNEDISKGQYTEVNATSYYKNNKIATYVNGEWTWKNCTLEEFASININSFNIDVNSVKNLNLTSSGKYAVLSFTIDDSESALFLGVSGDIKNLKFEIKTNSSYDQLVSFTMTFSQNKTSTEFRFTPYYGSVNVDIPK